VCLSKEGRRRQYMPLLAMQTPLYSHGLNVLTRDTAKSERQHSLSRLQPEPFFVCKVFAQATSSSVVFLQRAERKFQNPSGVVPSVLPSCCAACCDPTSSTSICDTLAHYISVLVAVLRFEPVQLVSSGLGAPWTLACQAQAHPLQKDSSVAEGLTARTS